MPQARAKVTGSRRMALAREVREVGVMGQVPGVRCEGNSTRMNADETDFLTGDPRTCAVGKCDGDKQDSLNTKGTEDTKGRDLAFEYLVSFVFKLLFIAEPCGMFLLR